MTTSNRAGLRGNHGLIGGAAGITFVALMVAAGVVQGDVPVYSDGPAMIKDWFASNNDRYLIGGFLIVLGAIFYLLFLSVLVTSLFRADGTSSPWPWLALLAGVHLLVAAQASVAFDGTLALLKGDVSDDVARALSAGDYITFLLLYPFAGIHTSAVSVCILRTGVLWRPLAWLGPLVGVGGLVATAAPLQHDPEGVLTVVGYITLFAFLAFSAGASLSLIRAPQAR